MEHTFQKLKDLNLSRDEVNRIGEALKKEEFRKLLVDYVEELQDPKNRQIYEEEVKQLEKERGQDIIFIHPKPGYVIKTSVNGTQKCFINICSNENVAKPSSSPSVKEGVRGLHWSLPHCLAPPREDVDNKGVKCSVFDVIFHSDTLHLASKNIAFRDLLNCTALEAVESNFNVNVDNRNLKFPRMNYKGTSNASIIRRPSKTEPVERSEDEKELYDKIYSEIDSQRASQITTKGSPKKTKKNNDSDTAYTTPVFVMKHRSHVDIQEFAEHKEAKLNVTIPKELVIEISLPLLKSSSDMNLDVTERTVQLVSEKPAKYKLNLTLPYHVNEINGTAKFDKDLKKLIITLPVKRNTFDSVKDDSGVESDLNSPTGVDCEEGNSEKELISEINHNVEAEVKVAKIRTSQSDNMIDDFLQSDKLYILPEHVCNIYEDNVVFTLQVKNVDEKSVVTKCTQNSSLVKVKFSSISSSFYTTHYAFFVKTSSHTVNQDDISVEIWDNNVILQITLLPSDKQFTSYYCGSSESDLIEKFIEEPAVVNKCFTSGIEEDQNEAVDMENNQGQQQPDNLSENDIPKHRTKAIDIPSYSCESSGDELSCSSFSPRKSKGILKKWSDKRLSLGRSISESSLDDYVCSSFENGQSSLECVIPEDGEMSTSLKKTVRFNDVVTRQLFRSNSSILGQKKKNQRKARNKKRANDRRLSESETSDSEGKREGDKETATDENMLPEIQDSQDKNEIKKDDADIFLLEINS